MPTPAPASVPTPRPALVAAAFAALKLAIQLLAIRPYGYFRDELYYLACADHLDWGYVDHPPLSIAVLKLWRALFGDSLLALRLPSALAGAAVVYLAGRLAMAAGGGLTATVLACVSCLAAPGFLAFHHYYSLNAFDHLFWILAAYLVARIVLSPRPVLWIALGFTLGLGLLNKWSLLWFGAGLALGLVFTPARRSLRTPWPYVCAAIAALLFAPHLAWQSAHGFPTLEFMHNALAEKYVRLALGAFLGECALLSNPATVPISIAGLFAPFFVERLKPFRALSIIVLTTLAIVASSGSGKPEYLLAATPIAVALGAAFWEGPLTQRLGARVRFAALAALLSPMLALFAIALPFGLPVLSERAFIDYAKRLGITPQTSEKKELAELPQFYADMHGWAELVDAAELAFASLREDEKRCAKVWARTGGYGPAAAVDFFGRARGLPRAISSHNSYWMWGYGADDACPVVVLGGDRARIEETFERITQVTTVECGYCMPYENHKPVYVARGMRRSWAELWPLLRHYE
uniref:Glycosyl transferase family protein n=1 Tax=Racemicystis crocea TaxID=1707966 RepID=A0A3S7V0N0_9BACT|nr:glycosyl transferase family protein [Racemicystis crocea]